MDTKGAGDLTEKLKESRVTHTIAAGSIEQNVPLEFDFSELPTARYRIKSKADVLRKALNLLNYVVRAQEEGGKLVVENKKDKSRKEVITL